MSSRIEILDQRLLQRRCVACGYDGALLRDGLAPRCAKCGCDLRKRPARSYVEMEGLWGFSGGSGGQPWPAEPWLEARTLHRWIAFMFLSLFGLVVIVYLAAAAFSV